MIVLLLLISLATASVLALQAHFSDVYHRATAEGVLHDYSSLIADEVIRRSAAEVGYYGYYPLVDALRREIQQSGNISGGGPSTFLSAQDARLKRAANLAKNLFQTDRTGARITFLGEQPGDETAAWLRQNLPRVTAPKNDPGVQVFNTQIGNVPHTFVAIATRGPQSIERIAGFEVDLSALTPWFRAALDRQPLMPPSLGHGQVTNAFLYVSIRDQGGIERLRLGQSSFKLAAVKPFGDVYQGVLSGFTVEASIDPQISRQIVIGGLPRSRLPFFLGLLALNTGLIVTAILQLRREMALQQLRDEFVSSVSHELRTPLTQIRMFTETLLLDRIRSDEERRRSLEIIDREARRLTQLVENVLQFSRAERRIDSLSREKRELAPLIQEIVDSFESMVAGDQTRFECRLSSGLTANVDPDAFRQIVINLLDNAVKYGPKPQNVVVGLEASKGTALFYVDDEGPGVPPAERKRIFEHFQRLERDRQSATAGTGVGLSVVKDLVTRHRGRCSVTVGSRGGARFVVELPLASAVEDAVKSPQEDLA